MTRPARNISVCPVSPFCFTGPLDLIYILSCLHNAWWMPTFQPLLVFFYLNFQSTHKSAWQTEPTLTAPQP
ncbi:hypothetical protein B0H11DRAFT_2074987 [Mycena galericulata]|nr:hypothetical protein B0H11DRAFT_2074987 [Mycena galericulata]